MRARMKKMESVPVISFVIGMAGASTYAFVSGRIEEIPFIFAIIGAAVGFISGLYMTVRDYKETGDGEGFWLLIVSPLLFLFLASVLGWLVYFLYGLFSGGFPI
jgi:hypothetical protein